MADKSPKRIGDVTELELCHHFLNEGYEVFRNLSSTGPVDFVTLDTETGEVVLYDSKTANPRSNKNGEDVVWIGGMSDLQQRLDVKLVTKYKGVLLFGKKVVLNECTDF